MKKRAKPSEDEVLYLSGLYNHLQSEALPDALPKHQNNPKACAYGLYAEQISGTSFTTPSLRNRRTWMYRIKPSVVHMPYKKSNKFPRFISDFSKCHATPQQYRWKPLGLPNAPTTFVEGIVTLGGSGSSEAKHGVAIHLYAANASMDNQAFQNSDGDLLIVPQLGDLLVTTEMGKLEVPVGEIVVIQRGIKFSVELSGPSRGYIAELFEGHFFLPERGPIGANGLANERDFLFPTAAFDDSETHFTIITKFGGNFFTFTQEQSPFNVVAYHGNYVPFKYDLRKYCAMNSVTFDHPDPSIFTVLTAATAEPGVAALDFVIFPKRWQVQWESFRLPYYHRNTMSEYMGNIFGSYEAKALAFPPGAGSLHSCMAAHGPDVNAFNASSSAADTPVVLPDGISFMFETTYYIKLTDWAITTDIIDQDYYKCWQGLESHFSMSSE
jgi:homogentisate 1,2-dioxygenase